MFRMTISWTSSSLSVIGSRVKPKVTMATFRKTLSSLWCPQFQYNFTQVLGMTIPQTSSRFKHDRVKVKVE